MPKYYKVIAQLKRKEVSNRQIAEMLGISRNTVNSAVAAIVRSGKSFREVSEMTDDEVNSMFQSSRSGASKGNEYVVPDYEALKKELAKPGVTLQLLWEEYIDQCRLSGKKGYQLTQFKKYFNDTLKQTGFKDIL